MIVSATRRPTGGAVGEGAAAGAVAGAEATGRRATVLGRLGFVARGALYLLLGVLAFRIAVGQPTDEAADKRGALELLAERQGGLALLVAVTLGLAAYACWRFVRVGTIVDRDERKQWAKRIGNAGIGVVYLATAAAGASLVLDGGEGDNAPPDAGAARGWTAEVLGWPGGRLVVAGLGLGFVVAAVWNGQRGVRMTFEKKLEMYEISDRQVPVVRAVAIAGHLGRAAAFAVIGWFLLQAAWTFDPAEPLGLDESLRRIAEQPWGPLAIVVAAAGLGCFGLFSFAEARWRRDQ